jgi:hypothetical protein
MNLIRYAVASAVMLIPASQSTAHVVGCPTPDETGETLQQRIVALADRHASGIDGLVVRILTADPPETCPVLRADQNPRQVLDQLIRFAVDQENGYLAAEVFMGLASGLTVLDELACLGQCRLMSCGLLSRTDATLVECWRCLLLNR